MKIIQLNISGAFKYIGSEHNDFKIGEYILHDYIDWFKKEHADIICLQEAQSDDMQGNDSQAEQIAKELGYNFFNTAVSPSHLEEGKFLSQSIITCFPIKESRFSMLPNLGLYFPQPDGSMKLGHDKGIQKVVLDIDGNNVTLCNLHFPPIHIFKRDIMELEFTHVREALTDTLLTDTDTEIVCGDFNCYGENIKTIFPRLFQNNLLQDTFEVPTTTPTGNYQLDHVLISPKHFKVRNFNVQDVGSDHFACIVDLHYFK